MADAGKPKLLGHSVRAKIRVFGAGGTELISQWGGTECFLSVEPVHGPVLVVVSSKHRRGEGHLFRLATVTKVFDREVANGKASIQLTHNARDCIVMIDSQLDIPVLGSLIAVLKNKSRWSEIESNCLLTLRNSRSKRSAAEQSGGVADRDHLLAQGDLAAAANESWVEAKPKAEDADDYELPLEAQRRVAELNLHQRMPFASVTEGRNVVVAGITGSGKSEWIRHLMSSIPTSTTLLTAATGPAAREIGGITLRAAFGIYSSKEAFNLKTCTQRIKNDVALQTMLANTETLVIDDADRVSGPAFEIFDQLARFTRNRHAEPFGGIRVICVGDFCELNVKPGEAPMSANAWQELNFVKHELTFPFVHAKRDPVYARLLSELRSGATLPAADEALLESRTGLEPPLQAVRIYLVPEEADAENARQLSGLVAMDGDVLSYTAVDSNSRKEMNLNEETILPPAVDLRVGQRVVLLIDLPAYGRSAGECGTLVAITSDYATEEVPAHPIILFDGAAEAVVLPTVESNVLRRGRVIACRTQFPVRSAYAVPLEVARRLHFEAAIVKRAEWRAKDFYIAASRVLSLMGLYIETSSSTDAHIEA